MTRTLVGGFILVLLSTAACATGADDESSAPAVQLDGVDTASHGGPTACPESLILCVAGYVPKTVGHCKQICVPECKPRCGAGEHCAECRTTTGTAKVCLPDGAVC